MTYEHDGPPRFERSRWVRAGSARRPSGPFVSIIPKRQFSGSSCPWPVLPCHASLPDGLHARGPGLRRRRLCHSGVDRGECLKVLLIVEELFTNTVTHGYGGESESPVWLAFEPGKGNSPFVTKTRPQSTIRSGVPAAGHCGDGCAATNRRARIEASALVGNGIHVPSRGRAQLHSTYLRAATQLRLAKPIGFVVPCMMAT